jgi:hypothetical protein
MTKHQQHKDDFKKGDRVTVFNQTMNGKPIIEGKATILGKGGVENQYKVKFDNAGLGDPGRNCLRFVFGWAGQQDEPEAFLAKAVAEWEEAVKANIRRD